jgi:cobalt-zinc-cadmium efflux system protein
VSTRPLALALAITLVVLVVEVAGGILTGSLALLADAGHMAIDAAALALSLGAAWLARRPATAARSFGYLRAEILAALMNAAALLAVTVYIFWEAFQRLSEPPEVESGPMLLIACTGLLANATSAWVLARGGGHRHDLNTRGAYLHVVGDMLGSVGAIAAALVMLATGWYLADPILSAGIGVLILAGSWRLLRESVDVLLEAAPAGMDTGAIRQAIVAVPGVVGVHDLHVWSITSGFVALSGHVEITGARPWAEVLQELAALLAEQFGIGHVTLQPEDPAALPESFRGCSLDSPEGLAACRALVKIEHGDHHTHAGRGH